MKISNHKCYYGANLSWDFVDRLNDRHRGCHAGRQRYKKSVEWNKIVRNYIKRGVLDDVNLIHFNPEEHKEEVNQDLF